MNNAQLALAAEEEMFRRDWEAYNTTPGRFRCRPVYTAGPQYQRVCAACNPPGSPFVAAVPWVVRGEDALVLVCDGCGLEVG